MSFCEVENGSVHMNRCVVYKPVVAVKSYDDSAAINLVSFQVKKAKWLHCMLRIDIVTINRGNYAYAAVIVFLFVYTVVWKLLLTVLYYRSILLEKMLALCQFIPSMLGRVAT